MSNDDKRQDNIIQEQDQANQRIIRAVEQPQEGVFKGQAPVNERIKQIGPNERLHTNPDPSSSDNSSDDSEQ